MRYEMSRLGASENFSAFDGEARYFQSHIHRFFQLIAVTDGTLEVFVAGNSYEVSRGEMILIFPNQLHSFNGKDCKYKMCVFTPELVSFFAKKVDSKKPINNKFLPDASLFNAIVEVKDNASQLYLKGLLYMLCAKFDESATYYEKSSDASDVLTFVLDYVEAHSSDDCSLEIIAKEMAYSYQYVSRCFNNTMKMSFNAYLNLCRVNKACYYLTNTDFSVSRCGMECGYKSLRSFNRNFKSCMNISPSEYRKKNSKTDV